MGSEETEGLVVGTTETLLPGSMPSPKAKELYAPESPGKPGAQPPRPNWTIDAPGSEPRQDVWLSSTKPAQEWCPVARTLDVDN